MLTARSVFACVRTCVRACVRACVDVCILTKAETGADADCPMQTDTDTQAAQQLRMLVHIHTLGEPLHRLALDVAQPIHLTQRHLQRS
jgi:hypothetical protein